MLRRSLIFFLFTVSLFASCPFCPGGKAKEVQTFYEDDLVLGIYPHIPLYEDHLLIIPKRHVERLEELTPEEMAAAFSLVQKIEKRILQADGLGNYLLLQKNGKSAGQTVPHVHFHIIAIPEGTWTTSILWRFLTDSLSSPLSEDYLKEKAAYLAEQIQAEPSW